MRRRAEVGKWFFDVQYRGMDYQRFDNFVKTVRILAVKKKQEPPEAAVMRRGRDYDGFIFEMKFKWPVSIVSWR